MLELNKVLLVGRLTRDPETCSIPSGASVTKFSLAVNRRRGRGQDDEVAFIDVEAWDKTADFIQQWFAKGKPIYIEGRLRMDRWQDRDSGQQRSRLLVVADRVQFAGDGKEKGEEAGPGAREPAPGGAKGPDREEEFHHGGPADDDLPF